MKMTYKQVLEAAFALGKRDRLKLREQLNINLDPKPVNGEEEFDDDGPVLSTDYMTEEEFVAELNRRAEEAERDPSVCIPWEVVRAEVAKELKNARRSPPTRQKRLRQRV
jgi:hypothetical protein